MTSHHRVAACALLLALAPASLLGQSARVSARENFRAQPAGDVIGVLEPGLALTRTSARDGWLEVDVEGWVWMRSLQATTAATGHDLVVSEAAGENLRDRPSGAILGHFGRGALLDERSDERLGAGAPTRLDLGRVGGHDGPRPHDRAGSSDGARVGRASGVSDEHGSRAGRGACAEPARRVPDHGAPARPMALLGGPGGDTIARLRSDRRSPGGGARGQLGARARRGMGLASLRRLGGRPHTRRGHPGAAGRRARPLPGRVVSWDLQFLSLERAERIRTDFFEGEPFLLTRHAAGGYVYVALGPDRLAEAGNLLPLERIHVVARVRTPASALTGSPILELMELSPRA
jgi:hypothetical protein